MSKLYRFQLTRHRQPYYGRVYPMTRREELKRHAACVIEQTSPRDPLADRVLWAGQRHPLGPLSHVAFCAGKTNDWVTSKWLAAIDRRMPAAWPALKAE